MVGAGPTGLMLACELKLAGVDVMVLEKRPAGTVGESRAPGINARTLESFAQRGLLERFLERGRLQPAVLFGAIPMFPARFDPRWPSGLILAQYETERILTGWATELDVPIRFSTSVVGLRHDDTGVDVLADGDSGWETMRGEFLVGCDGGRSVVRSLSAIPFTGQDPVSHWLVADARLDRPPDSPFGRSRRVGTFQISRTEPWWFRITVMRVTPPVDRSVPVSLQELRGVMLEGLGDDYGLREARWMSRFSDGFRQAGQYRKGRVLLAGDAAHTHSPVGGQGLNLGIQDAVNLGWKLAAALHGAPDRLLDSYHRERYPVAQAVMQLTKAQTSLMKPGTQTDALREVLVELLAMREVTERLCAALSGLAIRYSLGDEHPLLGCRMPNLALQTPGGDTDVYHFLRQARPVLLNLGAQGLTSALAPWERQVEYVEATTVLSTEDWRLPPVDAIFVRPDGYVAWVNPDQQPVDRGALNTALAQWVQPFGR